MTSSKGASSAEAARPFDFPMFSSIPYPKRGVTKVAVDRIRVEVSPRPL